MSFSDTFSELRKPLRNLQTSAMKGKGAVFGYLKGFGSLTTHPLYEYLHIYRTS